MASLSLSVRQPNFLCLSPRFHIAGCVQPLLSLSNAAFPHCRVCFGFGLPTSLPFLSLTKRTVIPGCVELGWRISVRPCLCLVLPLPSWLRHCLCLVYHLPQWLRQCLCFAVLRQCPAAAARAGDPNRRPVRRTRQLPPHSLAVLQRVSSADCLAPTRTLVPREIRLPSRIRVSEVCSPPARRFARSYSRQLVASATPRAREPEPARAGEPRRDEGVRTAPALVKRAARSLYPYRTECEFGTQDYWGLLPRYMYYQEIPIYAGGLSVLRTWFIR